MSELQHEYFVIFLYGLPAFLIVGKLFFGSVADFFDCLRYLLMPDVISLLRGDWHQDNWATLKVYIYFALCAGAMYSAHQRFYPS